MGGQEQDWTEIRETVGQDPASRRMEALVVEAKRGEDHAFYELIDLHKERLYRIAWTYLRSEQDALEAVQETVCRAYMKLAKLKRPQYFSTWLVRIMLNYCIDELKRRGRHSPLLLDRLPGEPEEGTAAPGVHAGVGLEDRLVLRHAIDALDEPEKLVIWLKYYEDMTITDISRVLSRPPGTIKTRLHRALGKLRENLMGKGREAHG